MIHKSDLPIIDEAADSLRQSRSAFVAEAAFDKATQVITLHQRVRSSVNREWAVRATAKDIDR